MSLEEMAEAYSKKWKVPIEEATKQIEKFLAKKPAGTERTPGPGGIPEADNIFPDPLGPISKKFQDINQAILSGAYTRKTLKQMSQPPEELKTLRERIDFFEKNLGQMMELVNTTMKGMQDTLEVQKAEKEKEAILGEVADIIRPLKEKLDLLDKAKEGNGVAMSKLTPEMIIEVGEKATIKAQEFLKKRGFKVELPKGLTPEQVETMIQEKLGTSKAEWEKESGATVEIEKERIRATENMLTGFVDRVFTIFLEPLKDKIHEAIEKGAFGPKRA